jgi:hypothetical protein
VRRHLIDALTPEQVSALREIGETIIARFEDGYPACTEGGCEEAPESAGCTDAVDEPSQSENVSPVSRSYAST